MSDTNAVKWLRAQEVEFSVLEYEFTEVGADHAAQAVGCPLESVCKTLIVETSGKNYVAAIIPGDQRLNAKLLGHAFGAKQVNLVEGRIAEKITGYRVGGISPFAMRRHLPTVIEESLLALDRILVNGGRRGILVEMAPETIVHLLDARPVDICRS